MLTIAIVCAAESTPVYRPLFPFFTMPFIKRRHCSEFVQDDAGLKPPAIVVPRAGDRNTFIEGSPQATQVRVHMDAMSEEDARRIWSLIPEAIRNAPGTIANARALHALANNCGYNPTDGMLLQVPLDAVANLGVSYYQSPGGFIVTGKDSIPKFIAFLASNMDGVPHRCKWEDMTGKEQYEWIQAWHVAGKESYQRDEAATNGLRGTDITARITTVAQLDAAMNVSPSLVNRRPDGHNLTAADFQSARRRLHYG